MGEGGEEERLLVFVMFVFYLFDEVEVIVVSFIGGYMWKWFLNCKSIIKIRFFSILIFWLMIEKWMKGEILVENRNGIESFKLVVIKVYFYDVYIGRY